VPDINEGLEIGGEPVVSYEEGNVNTQSGFEAAMGRAVTGEAPPEAPQPEEGEEGEGEAPAPEEGQPEEAPEVAPAAGPEDLQGKLDWAMSVIDRQGNELGDLRARVQEMQPQPSAQPEPIVNVEALLDQHGGDASIEWAINNAPHLIEPIARAWALSGDPEGGVFYADYRAEQGKLDVPQQQAPEQDPDLTQISTERKLAGIFKEYRETNPDAFAAIEPGIAMALQSPNTPDEIKMMITSGVPDHMRAGMRFLLPYAQIEAFKLGQNPPEAEPSAEATAKEEQRRDAARRTAIVTGSQRLQDAGAPLEAGELTSEQRIARFKDAFEEEPSTSIAAGLTFNGQPVLPARPKRS